MSTVKTDSPLPQPPVLTEKQLELNNAEQRQRALRFRDSISEGNLRFARASAVIKETETIFAGMKARSTAKRKRCLTSIQIERYADALAQVGDFKTAHSFDKTKGYDKIWKAVWRDDAKKCKCAPMRRMMQDGSVEEYSTFYTKRMIFSVKHNASAHLYICAKCGFMNAKP